MKSDKTTSAAAEVVSIGRCKGCDRGRRLNDGVCEECLAPPRGRRWAEDAHRCRTDKKYALIVYGKIKSERGRKLFEAMFGNPAAPTVEPRTPTPTGTYH